MNDVISAVLFDFGGVIADEGFRDGLLEIGRRNRLEPGTFFSTVDRIIADCGYLTGHADEAAFWEAVRRESGISGSDQELRDDLLRRFVIRPRVLGLADQARQSGATVALLTDQTNWIEEIDTATGLFRHFDQVFNSFRTGKSKRDASVFTDTCTALGVTPASALFVDDNPGHIGRARSRGLETILFTTEADLDRSFRGLWPRVSASRQT
jgi:putative hydrolase of the HAD superfamily